MNGTVLCGQKYIWRLPATEQQHVAAIASRYNLSFPIAQTLLSRGFCDDQAIESFLFCTRENDVGHASAMKDAEKAVNRILDAIEREEKILIFGDYDVDGITSSSLMMIALLPLKARINFFLPHRVKDGYGLSTRIVEQAARNGYSLIITVDNGITAFEPARVAHKLGIDLIITDHHKPHAEIPSAYAVVNPNQDDCSYGFKQFAGVGVVFKLLELLYEKKGLTLPAKAYELLLLGTIADVVPLIGENRFWVRHGLAYINKVESLSLATLKKNGKVADKPRTSSLDIGFSIAPQINALGRLEDPRRGVSFLIGSDKQEVQTVGAVLLSLNEQRKKIERDIYDSVVARIESGEIDLSQDKIIIAAQKGWQPGVIGLVASRLVSTYGLPTILLHITNDGRAKGSCRSIEPFNMFEALQSAEHLLEQFGGHAQAAGLSLPLERVAALKEHLNHRINQLLTPEDLQQKITIDGVARLGDLTKKIIADLLYLEPFGNANQYPTFLFEDVVLVQRPKLLKDLHVKCSIFQDGVIKPVIFFNRPEMYTQLQACEGPFSLAAQINENHWQGHVNVELNGVDIAFHKDTI